MERTQSLLARHLKAIDVERCGFGYEVGIAEPHDDPMAWSLYGRGFLTLWNSDHSPRWRRAVEQAIARLLEIRSRQNQGTAWGLPYAWKGQPAWHPYTITTAMCGDFLLDSFRAGLGVDRAVLRQLTFWLTDVIPWAGDENIACPEFAPGFPYLATNVAGRTAGFLLAFSATRWFERRTFAKALTALRYVLSKQEEDGYCFYGAEELNGHSTLKVDNLHTAYTVEGLLRSLPSLCSRLRFRLFAHTRSKAKAALEFYVRWLFERDRGFERVFVIPDNELNRWKKTRQHWDCAPMGDRWVLRDPEETRSWALGAALTSLASANRWKLTPLSSADWILSLTCKVAREDGRFAYKTTDPHVYVRHEAHLFYGLCCLLKASKASGPLHLDHG